MNLSGMLVSLKLLYHGCIMVAKGSHVILLQTDVLLKIFQTHSLVIFGRIYRWRIAKCLSSALNVQSGFGKIVVWTRRKMPLSCVVQIHGNHLLLCADDGIIV